MKDTMFDMDDFVKFAKKEFGYDITVEKCADADLFKDIFGVSFLEMEKEFEADEMEEDLKVEEMTWEYSTDSSSLIFSDETTNDGIDFSYAA